MLYSGDTLVCTQALIFCNVQEHGVCKAVCAACVAHSQFAFLAIALVAQIHAVERSNKSVVTMSRAFALDVSQPGAAAMALDQDWQAVGEALSNLGVHLAASLQLDASVIGLLRWLAVIAAIYLLILDRTNWRTNLLTALLVPYLALQLPDPIFGYLRSDIGAWIAFIAVVIRLFFSQTFPQLINSDLELPVAFILLIVTAPKMIVRARYHIISDIVCLLIGAYLLSQHTRHAGGFRRAFAESRGVPHTIGILLLFVAPVWALFNYIL